MSLLVFSQHPVVYSQFQPGNIYYGLDGYIEYRAGNLPIILTAPHGGELKPANIPDRTCGTVGIDGRTQTLIKEMEYEIFQLTGGYPHIIICNLSRYKLDANRDLAEATCGNPEVVPYWYDWNMFIDSAKAIVTRDWGKGFYIDIHGHGHSVPRLELGYLFSASELRLPDIILNRPDYIVLSSLRALAGNNINNLTHSDLLRGELALGTMLQNSGVPSVPSMQDPYPLEGQSYFSGGFNTGRNTSRNGGTIDGLQIEHHSSIRSNHTDRIIYSHKFANILISYLKLHYFPDFDQSFVWNSSDTGISLTDLDMPYNQDFNNVFAGDKTYYLEDNDPLFPGLYAFNTLNNTKPLEFRRYTVNSSTTGNGYLFNAGHSNNPADRALGLIHSSTTGPLGFGLRFVNNTGYILTSFDISFTGEQWRVGGSTDPLSVVPNILEFDYCTGPRVTNIRNGNYIHVPALDFVSPNTSTVLVQKAIDGNSPGNRVALSATINVTVLPGDEIMLRWKDMTDDPGFDHLLAIDDLSVIPRSTLTGVEENTAGQYFLTPYPNPATNNLHFMNPAGKDAVVRIFTIAGVCISTQQVGEGLATIDVSGLSPGMYILVLQSRGSYTYKARFVKS